jgi:hypothetical protein
MVREFTYDIYRYSSILQITGCIEDDTVSFVDIIADFQDNDIPTSVGDYMDEDHMDEHYFWNEFVRSNVYNEIRDTVTNLDVTTKVTVIDDFNFERVYISKSLIVPVMRWLTTNAWYVHGISE